MKFVPVVAAMLACVSAPAFAQDEPSTSRIEPYVAVMGGFHDFDNDKYNGAPPSGYRGWLVEGVAGLNFEMGPVFIGAEGSAAKGISKDIDWEYGAAGRLGFKAGKDSIFFAKVGYQWTQFNDKARPVVQTDRAYDGVTYGFGAELSTADMGGFINRSNLRFRAQVDTRGDFHSFRPMAGMVLKF